MSQRIVGLDIGSHSVKAIVVETTMRTERIVGYQEQPIEISIPGQTEEGEQPEPSAEGNDEAVEVSNVDEEVTHSGTLSEAVQSAVGSLKHRGILDGDVVVVGFGLDDCMQTRLKLPFAQRKQIEAILPVQLEDRFPLDSTELLSDFHVGQWDQQSQRDVTVMATRPEIVGNFLASLESWNIDPRIVDAGPARLLSALRFLESTPTGTYAILDIGHGGTDVCVVANNQVDMVRRVKTGGNTFTTKLCELFSIDPVQAEEYKHSTAYVDVSQTAPATEHPEQIKLRQACQETANQLCNELSRTFHGYLARGGTPIEQVILCGGGAMFRGLAQYMANNLSVPVELLQVQEATKKGAGAGVRAVAALGLAARGIGRHTANQVNLRRGPFAYRGDFEFIKARAIPLVVLTVLLIAAAIFAMIQKKNAIEARRDATAEVFTQLAVAVLGDANTDPRDVTQQLTQLTLGPALIPEFTAYEIFRDISSDLVALRMDDGITVEVERITVDIGRDVIILRGMTDSAESVELIAEYMRAARCLDSVSPTRTTQNTRSGLYDFEIRAVNKCD